MTRFNLVNNNYQISNGLKYIQIYEYYVNGGDNIRDMVDGIDSFFCFLNMHISNNFDSIYENVKSEFKMYFWEVSHAINRNFYWM